MPFRLTRRAALALPLAAPAFAQPAWPQQPIRIVATASPGTSTDVLARLLSEGFSSRLGQAFPVDGKPGADGLIGAQAFTQAAPGSALFFCNAGTITTLPLLHEKLPYDNWADLVPIATTCTDFLAYAVRADFPAQDMAGVFAQVRANPGKYSWSSAPGGTYLLTNAYLKQHGLDMSFVAYRVSTQAVTDTAAGRVDLTVQPLTPLVPLAQEGKLRILAVTPGIRAPRAPSTPTVREAGFPELEVEGFPGLFGWRGMPTTLVARLHAMVIEIIGQPEIVERFRGLGMVPRPDSTAKFSADLRSLHEKFVGIARLYGARPPE